MNSDCVFVGCAACASYWRLSADIVAKVFKIADFSTPLVACDRIVPVGPDRVDFLKVSISIKSINGGCSITPLSGRHR